MKNKSRKTIRNKKPLYSVIDPDMNELSMIHRVKPQPAERETEARLHQVASPPPPTKEEPELQTVVEPEVEASHETEVEFADAEETQVSMEEPPELEAEPEPEPEPEPDPIDVEEILSNKKAPHVNNAFIYTDDLSDLAVTGEKIAPASIDSSKLKQESIHTESLADYAVQTIKIADGAVTSSKIAPDSITVEHLSDASVAGSKLQDRSIGGENFEMVASLQKSWLIRLSAAIILRMAPLRAVTSSNGSCLQICFKIRRLHLIKFAVVRFNRTIWLMKLSIAPSWAINL